MYRYEKKLWQQGFTRLMGLDEAGRGCLAGPVVAAGVILHPDSEIPGVNDSKKLSRRERERLADKIKDEALFWSIQKCSVDEIASLNILWASLRAMEKCVNEPRAKPDYLLIDGNRFMDSLIPCCCLVKGDGKSASIAAASVLAKVYRDQLMRDLHDHYPHYGWKTNVGYPTEAHYRGLMKFGYTPHHRLSFNLRTDTPCKESEKAQE